jgi:hypothetical protein
MAPPDGININTGPQFPLPFNATVPSAAGNQTCADLFVALATACDPDLIGIGASSWYLHELIVQTRISVYLPFGQALYFSFSLPDQRRLAGVVQHGVIVTQLELSIAFSRATAGRQTNSLVSTVVISLISILLPIPVVVEILYWRKICRTKPLRLSLFGPR